MTPDEYNQKMFDNMRRRAESAEAALEEARKEVDEWQDHSVDVQHALGVTTKELDHWRGIAEAMAGECCEEKCSHNCCSHKIRAIVYGSGEGER